MNESDADAAEDNDDEARALDLQRRLEQSGRVELGYHHLYLYTMGVVFGTVAALMAWRLVQLEGVQAWAMAVVVAVFGLPVVLVLRELLTSRPVLVVDTVHVRLPRKGQAIPWTAVRWVWPRYLPGGGSTLMMDVDPAQLPIRRDRIRIPGPLDEDPATLARWLGREANVRNPGPRSG